MKRMFLLVSIFCLLTGTAFASLIDFRDAAMFGAACDQPSFSTAIDGLEITIEAQPGEEGAVLWWDETDGFGVQYSYEPDEIEGCEALVLDFSPRVFLAEVLITDLFFEWGYREIGFYELDGSGEWIPFRASLDQPLDCTSGELLLTIGAYVDFITFAAPGRIWWQHHEFSVGSVDATPVPLPGTLLLLGSGLLGLFGIYRIGRR